MKIAILIDQLVSGGVQKAAIQEAKELVKLGHSATLFVLIRLQYNYQYEDLSPGLSVVYLSDLNPLFFRRAFRIPFFSFLTYLHLLAPFFVSRYHIFKQYDFIISHGTTTCITGAAIARKFQLPYLAFVWDPLTYILEKVYGTHRIVKHFLSLLRLIAQWYEKDFLLSAALVATASQVHQKYLKSTYQVNPLVIYPGIELSKKNSTKRGSFILGYTRWQLAKNPRFFLHLAQKFPSLKFLVAGEWSNKTEELIFRSEIRSLKLDKQIKLWSTVTRADLPKLATRSFVWLHPHFEAFGMAGLEMAALGLPIIIPERSGVSEIFTHRKEGFFPKSLHEQELGEYLIFLSTHPSHAKQMGLAAAQKARKYSWKYHTQLLNNEILKYVSQKKITATFNAFVTTAAIGGGDRFFIELARRIPKNIHLTIILPQIGLTHFKRANISKPNIRFVTLPENWFDAREVPLFILLAYLIRAVQTFNLLPKLAPFTRLHTATDLVADTLPAFLHKLISKKIIWVARFFHFYGIPWKRQGPLIRNTGSFLLQRLSLLLFRKADTIIVDNPLLMTDLRSHLPSQTKIAVSTGGVDMEIVSCAKPNQDFFSTAVLIGRLSPHKGVYDAIAAWKIIVKKHSWAKLAIIGYTPTKEMDLLKQKIISLGLTKHIKLIGYIHDRKLLYQYLASSKLLLFLDHEAGFGLVVAEAMATHLPVVAYDLPLFGVVYKKGFRTVHMKDIQGVARCVSELLTDQITYRILSDQAYEQAKSFDWDTVSRTFYQILNT